MEMQAFDLLLNSVYHIIAKMEGGNSVQIFILTNIIWMVAFFFATRKSNQMFNDLFKITEQQGQILDKIDEVLKENEHRQEINRLHFELEILRKNQEQINLLLKNK